jgi:hypothetical protein
MIRSAALLCLWPSPVLPPASPAGVQGTRWPNFTWVDRGRAIVKGDYQHWGGSSMVAGSASTNSSSSVRALLEPNNLFPPENCAAANVSDAALQDGVGTWADHSCLLRFVSICEFVPLRLYPAYSTAAGNNFTFYGALMGQATAEAVCLQQGGHLAVYASYEEQREVEQHFISMVGATRAVRQHAYLLLSPYVALPGTVCAAHPCIKLCGSHMCKKKRSAAPNEAIQMACPIA